MHKMFKMLAAALITAFGLSAYAGHDFTYSVVSKEPTNTWIGVSGASWNDGSNWEKGVAVTNREYALINTAAGVSISADYGFEATGVIVAPEAGKSSISVPSTWGSSGITLRKSGAKYPGIINLSDYPFEMDVIVYFNSNGNGDGAVLPNVVYKRSFKTGSKFGSGTVHFLSGVGEITDSWNTSTIQKDANFSGHPIEIQPLHRVLLDNKNASLTCSTLTVNGELQADSAKVTCDEIAGTGTVRLNGATITTADLDSTATIILSGANTLKYTGDVTIGKLVFADPNAKLTLSGTGTVTYSDAFNDSTCLTAEGLYVPADYKASEVNGVIGITPSYDGYVKNKSNGGSTTYWTDKTFWTDDYPAEAGKRYYVDGSGSEARVNSPEEYGKTITFPGDVLTLVNGASVNAPAYLALKSTKTAVENLRLGNKAGVDFRTNNSGSTTQTLSGNIYIDSTATDGAVIRGTKGNTNIVYSTISGTGILRIAPLESNNNGFAARLAGDNSGFTGKLYIDWRSSNSASCGAIVIVDDVNQLGGNPASYKGDGLRINASRLVVNETMTLPENRGLRFLREAVIEVAEGKTFTAGKSNFYQDSNTTSSLVKDGAGDLVLADTVTTSDKSKTITVLAGTVTLPIDTDYTLGANTVVQSQTETTVTLAAKASTPEIDPEEGSVVVPEATDEADAISQVTVKVPTGLDMDAADYKALFHFSASGSAAEGWTVTMDDFSDDAKAAIKTEEQAVLDKAVSGGTVSVTKGLCYGTKSETELEGVKDDPATELNKTGTLTIDAGNFIKIRVTAVPVQ